MQKQRHAIGSSVHGIFQARVLEWIAISFSRGSSPPRNRTRVSLIAGRHFTIWATFVIPLLEQLPKKIHFYEVYTYFCLCIMYKYIYCVCMCVLSHVWFFPIPWTVPCQAPLSMGFSRQEYWSGLPFPSLEDLPDPGMYPHLLCLLHWQEILHQ